MTDTAATITKLSVRHIHLAARSAKGCKCPESVHQEGKHVQTHYCVSTTPANTRYTTEDALGRKKGAPWRNVYV